MQPDTALQLATTQLNRVRAEIGKIIVGQQDVVDGVLICLLAGGHVLLEGVPGLGKTTLLRTLSKVMHLKYSRIQFTPDLMPADIVGSMIIDSDERIQGSALLARPDLRASGAGRRDQSRDAQNAVRAARSHAGTHRHQRNADHGTGASVPGHGDAEPHRDGRDLSASRSAARPVPDEDPGALSFARRTGHHRRTHQPERRDRGLAGGYARRNSGAARGVPSGSGRARMCRITPSTW